MLGADDARRAPGSTNDFEFDLLLLVAALLVLLRSLLLVTFGAGELPILRSDVFLSDVFLLASGADNRDAFEEVEDEGDGPAASAILRARVRLAAAVLFESEAGAE